MEYVRLCPHLFIAPAERGLGAVSVVVRGVFVRCAWAMSWDAGPDANLDVHAILMHGVHW